MVPRGAAHLVWQLKMLNCDQVHGSTHVTTILLQERCSKNLQHLNFAENTHLPPNYYTKFFAQFKNLTKLNVKNSMVDDNAYRAIGENCDKLVQLDGGGTYITNIGIKYLCFDELMPMMPCLPGLQLYRYW